VKKRRKVATPPRKPAPAAETASPPIYRVPLLGSVSAQVVAEGERIDRGALAVAGALLLLVAIGGAVVTALARRELWGRPA